jgi:hypothetical protein
MYIPMDDALINLLDAEDNQIGRISDAYMHSGGY